MWRGISIKLFIIDFNKMSDFFESDILFLFIALSYYMRFIMNVAM